MHVAEHIIAALPVTLCQTASGGGLGDGTAEIKVAVSWIAARPEVCCIAEHDGRGLDFFQDLHAEMAQ